MGRNSCQHSGANVKFLLELGDEDVDRNEVAIFNLSNDIRHPLKLSLCPCHPQEVHLHTNHLRHTTIDAGLTHAGTEFAAEQKKKI